MYLSPDQRFLTDELLDTSLDPVEEERRANAKIMDSLSLNKGASLGPVDAPVTIVEFSDFQCPYCRKFNSVLSNVLKSYPGQVRVVFHHMPIQSHDWARAAAEGAACAQLQSAESFWKLNDEIFANQDRITASSLKQQLIQFARNSGSVNLPEFQECLDNQMSLGLVLRDLDLGAANNVSATPTIFVNGQRFTGLAGESELAARIKEAKSRSVSAYQ